MYKKYTDLSTLHDPRVDEVLKKAAMGGDPNYPQVYAIMAIQARTAAKGQAQQMQGAQGPQPTVAENVIAQAAPPNEQGMASLPISSDTFHAAGGGMVSFARGGDMSGRGDMHDSAEHKKLVKKAAEAKARALAEFGASQTGYNFPSEYVSPAGDGISSPEMNAMIDDASRRQNPQAPAAFSPEQMQALGQSQGVDPNAAAVARTRSMYNVAPPASEGIVDLPAAGRGRVIGGAEHYRNAVGPDKAPTSPDNSDAAAAYGNFAQSMSRIKGVPPAPKEVRERKMQKLKHGLEHGFFGDKRPKLAMDSAKAASAKASSDEAPDASTSGKKPAITMAEYNKLAAEGVENRRKPAAVGKINREKPATEVKKDDKKGADKGITALKTNVPQAEKDIAAETAARYHKMVGEDPDAVDRKARMEALGLSNAEEKRKAPWMALANAGFGMMAGPSQYAMQNIGAGAQQGLASLTEQQKDMARAQERHAAMQDAIGERDYARRAKGAELGMTTEAASKKAAQDESQFARDIASRERVAGITAAGMQSRIGAQETGIMLRGLDKALVAANNELMLATTKKEKDAIKARIASLTTQMNQYLGMGDMQAGAPVGGSLVADKSGMMNYTPAS
jgi:hypothetical protein